MSRSAPAITSTLPVAPGTAVVTPMYTSVGFNAGDYVYQYGANLVGWPKGSTVSLGANNTLIAGNTYTGYVQTSDSRAVSYGPFTDQITYSGTTTTVGQTIVSPTTLSGATLAHGACRCAVLTGGNVAYIYRSTGTTLTGAIYNSAGVLQGSTVTLTTTLNYSATTLTMCAMPDGGYIAGWCDSSIGFAYSRVSSANAVTSGPTQVSGGSGGTNGTLFAAASPNYYAFSYNFTLGTPSYNLKVYNLSNSSTGTYNTSLNNINTTACVGTSADTFYLLVGDYTNNNWSLQHINTSAGQIGSTLTFSTCSNSYSWVAGCGSTTNATYSGACNAWFMFPNSSGQLQTYRFYGTASAQPTYQGVNQGTAMTQAAVASTNNGGAMLVYRNSSTGILQAASFNAAANQVGSTVTLVASAVPDVVIGASGFAGASFAYGYGANATSYPTLQTAYSVAYTNGVTSLTGTTSYTPANGYYVLGVALTTAAAGATGMVATNGSANLSSSYPNVTSNILFDYTGTSFTARSAINANRGNVIGTNVTLRGLE